jgi:endonuclease/exonuclease/phosphatase family metal-dependent hydrolase
MFASSGSRLAARAAGALLVVAGAAGVGAPATAQTIVLNQPRTQVTDTTIRGGTYGSTNFDEAPLMTRRSTDLVWERRALLKFDTYNTIARGTPIASATLTLTVKSGLGTTLRPVAVHRVPQAFQEAEATWTVRQGTSRWTTAGGTIAEQFAQAAVPSTPGSRVVIDLTALVQRTINDEFDSRYTRVRLSDSGDDAKESYREYFGSEDPVVENRPTLTIVLGTGATAPPPPAPEPPPDPAPAPSPGILKVLQWNIAQGYATDGRSNLDRVVAFIVEQRPDVVSFNEIVRRSSSSQPQYIADRLTALTGETWTYHWIQKTGLATGEGECVMTRLPIEAVDDYLLTVSRSVAMARVTVNGRTVHLYSTHLDHQSSATRLAQVRQLVTWSSTHAEQRILAGDFNGWPGTQEIDEMLRTHVDGWAAARAAGTAVSFAGNPDGNTRNSRIDYVFHSRGATAVSVAGAQVFDTRDAAGVRTSDHHPLIVTYRIQ